MSSPQLVSIIVTTFRTDSFYTQACLESIRRWKNTHHELIVVTHDESPLLRAWLDACATDGLIDRLVYAESNHGHTRGFNLGACYANADVIFNVCNDILVGPSLIDDCAWKLRNDRQLGIIGWHWYNEGTFWKDGRVVDFALQDADRPDLDPQHLQNIRNASWFTGRYFEAIGGPRWLHLCNTSFFGIRRNVLEAVGGGFSSHYQHYWADDFLCYAVLDQGLDVRHFDPVFRNRSYFDEFQNDNLDVPDRRRHHDGVCCNGAFLDSIRLINGGLSEEEAIYLHLLAKSVPDGATVTNIGVWKGASAIILLDALRSKRVTFHFIDGFDLPGISQRSNQPPVPQEEFFNWIAPYVGNRHAIHVHRVDTATLDRLPRSDLVFVDGGHTKECVSHDAIMARESLTAEGVAVFHDYGCPIWPDVAPAIDEVFPSVDVYESMAVYRSKPVLREVYEWP